MENAKAFPTGLIHSLFLPSPQWRRLRLRKETIIIATKERGWWSGSPWDRTRTYRASTGGAANYAKDPNVLHLRFELKPPRLRVEYSANWANGAKWWKGLESNQRRHGNRFTVCPRPLRVYPSIEKNRLPNKASGLRSVITEFRLLGTLSRQHKASAA